MYRVRKIKLILASTLLIVMVIGMGSDLKQVQAIESTAYTYTLAVDWNGYLRTQDAYMPGGIYLNKIGLNAPEDLYYKDNTLYIADSGNGRIVKYDLINGNVDFLGVGGLKYPTGVAVGKDGTIYVADYQASEVVVMSPVGDIIRRIGRPEDINYGTSPYKPRKVDIDTYANIFVISEGTHEGILQFSEDGVFHGFFGANKTRSLSLIEWFQKLFYTDEQKSKLFFRTPPNIVSLDVTDENLIYSVTQNERWDSIKKLNLAGVNVLQRAGRVWGEKNFVDTAVTSTGNIYAVTDTGSIEEFDDTGVLLLMFGGRAASSDRNGLTAVVSAIEVDDDYNIYVLDKERALIQAYYSTNYTKIMHKAINDYNQGYYKESLEGWSEILRLNPSAYMAHNGYADAMFQLGEYEIAAEHYKLMYDQERYSECYMELRSEWLRNNMNRILTFIILLTVLIFVLWLIGRKVDYMNRVHTWWEGLKKKHRILKELIEDTSFMIRHPIDCVYYLKTGQRGSMQSAGILYIIAYLVYMFYRGFTSFVFGGGIGYWQNPFIISIIIILPVILFVVGSYLISSINDGEGTIKNVYVSVGYSFSAYILFLPPLTIISHVLTTKEEFLYQFSYTLIIAYTLILIFLSVKETHCYTPGKTIANILLTIAFMIIAILAVIILYILWKELFAFMSELYEEVKYRVFM
ncbi:MAG: hypothetical protein EWM47_00700 [Anaerolineaceae bacterium]|nr:MAG: hypothetical protein EWM47_00700 [Anaerolineaceae bacterium]